MDGPRTDVPADGPDAGCAVLTIGHSTRPIEVFIELLQAHGVTQLIDVRTVPRSRHNPQFNEEPLQAALAGAHIGYARAPAWAAFAGPRPTRPTPAGATSRSAATPTTCRRRSSTPSSPT